MKKILFIENRPDYGLGGIENYNKKLIKILKHNFPNVIIDKCNLLNTFDDEHKDLNNNEFKSTKYTNWISNIENPILFNLMIGFHLISFRKLVYQLVEQNHYNLIIDSTITYFRKLKNNPNYYWVQHITPEYYDFECMKNKFLRSITFLASRLFGIRNPIKQNHNIIVYDKKNLEVAKILNPGINATDINLSYNVPNLDLKKEDIKNRKGIIYLGRINQEQKNISFLNKINKKLQIIDFYGAGNQKYTDKLGSFYKGAVENNDVGTVISKYKYCILLSNYEGFSFSLVEALSYGVPIIVLNTFCSASYLVDNNSNGLLINKNDSLLKIEQKIIDLLNISEDKYFEFCKNAYRFAKQNLTDDIFNKKWLNIFNKYLKE